MKKMTTFDPKKDGFHFPNTFKDWVLGQLAVPGRCGGMCYAALDYFNTRRAIPKNKVLPPDGSVLSTYIWQRQYTAVWNTWDKFWSRELNVFGSETDNIFRSGITTEFPIVKSQITENHPVPLGLVVPSGSPFDVAKNHFVVAVGFEGSGDGLTIFAYDPDHPGETALLKPNPKTDRWILSAGKKQREWVTYFVDQTYATDHPPPSLAEISGKDWHGRNMTGQDLAQGDYRKGNFRDVIFHGADLHLGDFSLSDCVHCEMVGANLGRADFILADVHASNMTGADLREASFKGANLRGCNLTGARMGLLVAGQSNLDGATFLGADLSQAQLPGASAIASIAYGARFNVADLRGLHFQRTDVHGSDFRQAILDGADLSNAMAYGADFENARLLGANFQGTYLEGSDFGSANLTKASLKEADLHGADLSNADCTGADFTGANLEGCDLSGTILKNAKNVRR